MKYHIEFTDEDLTRFRVDTFGSHGKRFIVLKDINNRTRCFELKPDGRPHGKWEFIGENLFWCKNCGYIADADYLRNWKAHTSDAEFPTACPKCGADMVKREGDEKCGE